MFLNNQFKLSPLCQWRISSAGGRVLLFAGLLSRIRLNLTWLWSHVDGLFVALLQTMLEWALALQFPLKQSRTTNIKRAVKLKLWMNALLRVNEINFMHKFAALSNVLLCTTLKQGNKCHLPHRPIMALRNKDNDVLLSGWLNFLPFKCKPATSQGRMGEAFAKRPNGVVLEERHSGVSEFDNIESAFRVEHTIAVVRFTCEYNLSSRIFSCQHVASSFFIASL